MIDPEGGAADRFDGSQSMQEIEAAGMWEAVTRAPRDLDAAGGRWGVVHRRQYVVALRDLDPAEVVGHGNHEPVPTPICDGVHARWSAAGSERRRREVWPDGRSERGGGRRSLFSV